MTSYNPQTELDRELFPNLGRVRIIGGPAGHIGREGTIIKHGHAIRVAFDNFWTRPDGMSAEEADDNGWFFDGEWEKLE